MHGEEYQCRGLKAGDVVSTYDWKKLKRLFISGKCKTLREFAEAQGVPYGQLRRNATGWVEEKRTKTIQKEDKITEGILARQVEFEVDRNAAHLAFGDMLLMKLNAAVIGVKPSDKNAVYVLSTAATALEKIQKSQRLGEGKRADQSLMQSLLAVMEGVDE